MAYKTEDDLQELKMAHRNFRLSGHLAGQHNSWPQARARPLAAVLFAALVVLLNACGRTSSTTALPDQTEAISLEALPAGLGRGFPAVVIDANASRKLQVGVEAPNFRLLLADGRHVALHHLRGRPVLINFWASWCSPCRLEMPDIVRQAQTNPELVVLAVNVQETMQHVRPFAEEFQMTMPVGLDTNAELRNLYQVRGMPTSVFIDRKGNIAAVWAGMLTADLLEEIIAELG